MIFVCYADVDFWKPKNKLAMYLNVHQTQHTDTRLNVNYHLASSKCNATLPTPCSDSVIH